MTASLIQSAPARRLARTTVPHRLRPVDDERRPPRKRGDQARFEARAAEEAVSVAARLADQRDGDLQPRPGHVTVPDRIPEPAVGTREIAHEGDAGLEREAGVLRGLERPLRHRRPEDLGHVDGRHRDVVVAVEDARQQPEAREVDRGGALRRQVPVDARDPAVLDVDVHRAAEAAAPVEHHDLPQDVRFALVHRKASSRARWSSSRRGSDDPRARRPPRPHRAPRSRRRCARARRRSAPGRSGGRLAPSVATRTKPPSCPRNARRIGSWAPSAIRRWNRSSRSRNSSFSPSRAARRCFMRSSRSRSRSSTSITSQARRTATGSSAPRRYWISRRCSG